MALLKYLCSRLFTTANVDTPGRHHRGDFNPMARPSIDAESLSGSKHYVIAFPSPADKKHAALRQFTVYLSAMRGANFVRRLK